MNEALLTDPPGVVAEGTDQAAGQPPQAGIGERLRWLRHPIDAFDRWRMKFHGFTAEQCDALTGGERRSIVAWLAVPYGTGYVAVTGALFGAPWVYAPLVRAERPREPLFLFVLLFAFLTVVLWSLLRFLGRRWGNADRELGLVVREVLHRKERSQVGLVRVRRRGTQARELARQYERATGVELRVAPSSLVSPDAADRLRRLMRSHVRGELMAAVVSPRSSAWRGEALKLAVPVFVGLCSVAGGVFTWLAAPK